MTPAPGRFLEELAARLPGHAVLLEALCAMCRSDSRLRTLELQCSVARGAGDELSDLDVGIGVVDDEFDALVSELPDRLRRLAAAASG